MFRAFVVPPRDFPIFSERLERFEDAVREAFAMADAHGAMIVAVEWWQDGIRYVAELRRKEVRDV